MANKPRKKNEKKKCDICGVMSGNLTNHIRFKHNGESPLIPYINRNSELTPISEIQETPDDTSNPQVPIVAQETKEIEQVLKKIPKAYRETIEKNLKRGAKKPILSTPRSSIYSPEQTLEIQRLIDLGIVRDLNDFTEKAGKLLYQDVMSYGGVKSMLNLNSNERDPEKEMDDIQRRKMRDAYIKQLSNEANPNTEMIQTLKTMQEQKMDPMSLIMIMEILDRKDRSRHNPEIDTLKQEIQSLKETLVKRENPELLELKQKLNELTDKKNDILLEAIKAMSQVNSGNSTFERFATKQEEIKAASEKQIAEIRAKLDEEKEKRMNDKLEEIKRSVSGQVGGDSSLSQKLKEKIEAIVTENFDRVLIAPEPEKSSLEKTKEILDTVGKAFERPIAALVAPIGQAAAEKIRGIRGNQSAMTPPVMEPQMPPDFSNFPNTTAGLTKRVKKNVQSQP